MKTILLRTYNRTRYAINKFLFVNGWGGLHKKIDMETNIAEKYALLSENLGRNWYDIYFTKT